MSSTKKGFLSSSLEHFEVVPDQLKMFGVDSERMKFDSLQKCVQVARAFFVDDKHKIVRTFIACYRALVERGEERYCIGISTKRAVYVKLEKKK